MRWGCPLPSPAAGLEFRPLDDCEFKPVLRYAGFCDEFVLIGFPALSSLVVPGRYCFVVALVSFGLSVFQQPTRLVQRSTPNPVAASRIHRPRVPCAMIPSSERDGDPSSPIRLAASVPRVELFARSQAHNGAPDRNQADSLQGISNAKNHDTSGFPFVSWFLRSRWAQGPAGPPGPAGIGRAGASGLGPPSAGPPTRRALPSGSS